MAIQKKEVEYAKEMDDVGALLVKIVKEAKEKKPVGDIASGSVQALIDAISGVDQVGVEFDKSRKVALQTILSRVGELVDAVLPAKV